MTEIRFLNGLDTIGGNIMEISTDTSRIICDFGIISNIKKNYDIDEEIAQHNLPNVPEIFTGNKSKFKHEAIFISHLHLDHTGAIPFIESDIPVYLSEKSYELYKILVDSKLALPVRANIHTYNSEVPIKIGDLTVNGFASDHDVIDPMALLINDGTNNFGYSGDVRLHGPNKENVNSWMTIFRQKKLKMFMIEGTAFSFDELPIDQRESELSESDIAQQFEELIAERTQDLITLNLYPRNVNRLVTFNRIGNESNREIVWELPFAKIIKKFYPSEKVNILSDDPDQENGISLKQITSSPTKYILQNSFVNLNRLNRFSKVTYVHSNGEPLGDYDSRYKTLIEYLKQRGFTLKRMAASGHAKKSDLIKMVEEVSAEQTVLWHSFHPDLERDAMMQQNVNRRLLLPQRNQIYKF